MIVVGLDTASDRWHAAQASPRESLLYRRSPRIPKGTSADARRQILSESFREYLELLGAIRFTRGTPVHIFCEEPGAFGPNGLTTRLLCLAAGALWNEHIRYDVYWHWVDIATWQSYVGAKGKSAEKKAHARQWLIDRHEAPNDLDEDHYDAGCIAAFGSNWLLDAAVVPADIAT